VSNSTSSAPAVVASLAISHNCIPIIEAQFFTQLDGSLLRPINETTAQGYKEVAVAFAGRYKPEYLGLGIEVMSFTRSRLPILTPSSGSSTRPTTP